MSGGNKPDEGQLRINSPGGFYTYKFASIKGGTFIAMCLTYWLECRSSLGLRQVVLSAHTD
jgi:hypothetical protein